MDPCTLQNYYLTKELKIKENVKHDRIGICDLTDSSKKMILYPLSSPVTLVIPFQIDRARTLMCQSSLDSSKSSIRSSLLKAMIQKSCKPRFVSCLQ